MIAHSHSPLPAIADSASSRMLPRLRKCIDLQSFRRKSTSVWRSLMLGLLPYHQLIASLHLAAHWWKSTLGQCMNFVQNLPRSQRTTTVQSTKHPR